MVQSRHFTYSVTNQSRRESRCLLALDIHVHIHRMPMNIICNNVLGQPFGKTPCLVFHSCYKDQGNITQDGSLTIKSANDQVVGEPCLGIHAWVYMYTI